MLRGDGYGTAAVTIAVLAGGQSRRMGQDKSFVRLKGKPLLQHVIDRVSSLGWPLILVASDIERYQQFGLPVCPDIIPGVGSLGGLYSALTHSQTEYTVCLACDMPLVNSPLLRYLFAQTSGYDAVVPRVNDVAQGLHAVYHRRCLPLMQMSIQQGQLKIRGIFEQLNVRYVDEPELLPLDPNGLSFKNLNTPEDVAQCGDHF